MAAGLNAKNFRRGANMKETLEHKYLFQYIVNWFNEQEQVAHYTGEIEQGPTPAEQYLLDTRLPETGDVLDIGCGAGRISFYLARRGYGVTGVDVSRPLLAAAENYAEKHGHFVHWVLTEADELPFPDNRFRAAIAFKVLCYIPTRPLRIAYLQRIFRMLQPGGTCLMAQHVVPAEAVDESVDEYFHRSPGAAFSILERGDTFPAGAGYVHWFTEEELMDEIGQSGFMTESVASDEPFGGSGYVKLIVLKKPAHGG